MKQIRTLFFIIMIINLSTLTACYSVDEEERTADESEEMVERTMSLPAPKKDECAEGDCESEKSLFRWTNGDNYWGEYDESRRSGDGTYIWKSGAKYKGDWEEGKRNGKGTYYYTNGDIYVGDFVDDKRDGSGVYTYADETVHPAREWSEGQPSN